MRGLLRFAGLALGLCFVKSEQRSGFVKIIALLRTEQTIVSHLDEAGWQYMLQEAGDEVEDRHGSGFPLLGPGGLVTEGYHAVFGIPSVNPS